MCGIFGVIASEQATVKTKSFQRVVKELFVLSESRGREAAGVAVLHDDSICVHKDSIPASLMIKTRGYREIFQKIFSKQKSKTVSSVAVIGHSRLVTNGLQGIDLNNQPFVRDNIIGVHNGIVVNDDELWCQHSELKRYADVDTEIILALIDFYKSHGVSVVEAVRKTFLEIEGEASIATLFADLNFLVLATNTGSIYYHLDKEQNMLVFASESFILEKLYKNNKIKIRPVQVQASSMTVVDLGMLTIKSFKLSNKKLVFDFSIAENKTRRIIDKWHDDEKRRKLLRRCTKCLLPATMPFIIFDHNGVCNYCNHHDKMKYNGKNELNKLEF